MSPAVTHGVPKMQRENHAKQKIQKVVHKDWRMLLTHL